MRSKGLLTLIAVTLLAVIAAAAAALTGPRQTVDPLTGKPVLPQVTPKLQEIAKIALTKGEAKTTLERKDGVWRLVEKNNYPADPTKVRAVLLGLAQLTYVEPKTGNPQRYGRIEVEDAGKPDSKSTLVVATDDKGAAVGEVIVGKRRQGQLGGGNDAIYVRLPTGAQSWLARSNLDLSSDLPGWLDKKILDVDGAALKSVTLTQPNGEKLTVSRDKPEASFAIQGAPADIKLRSESAPGEPSYALAGLELSDVRDAAGFPFLKEGANAADYETFDGLKLHAEVFQVDSNDWARFTATGSGEAEARAKDLNAKLTPWVFQIPNYKARSMKTKLADLLETPKGS